MRIATTQRRPIAHEEVPAMMPVGPVTELGRLTSSRLATAGLRHQLLHLVEQDVVVLPYAHTASGWHAVIVAGRTPVRTSNHLRLSGEQITSAATTININPDTDPDGYACLLWLSRVFQRWPAGPTLAVARLLAYDLRPAGHLHVPGEILAARADTTPHPPGLRSEAVAGGVIRLTAAGLLTRTNGSWVLSLPEQARPQ